jgi:hypothetical protein
MDSYQDSDSRSSRTLTASDTSETVAETGTDEFMGEEPSNVANVEVQADGAERRSESSIAPANPADVMDTTAELHVPTTTQQRDVTMTNTIPTIVVTPRESDNDSGYDTDTKDEDEDWEESDSWESETEVGDLDQYDDDYHLPYERMDGCTTTSFAEAAAEMGSRRDTGLVPSPGGEMEHTERQWFHEARATADETSEIERLKQMLDRLQREWDDDLETFKARTAR